MVYLAAMRDAKSDSTSYSSMLKRHHESYCSTSSSASRSTSQKAVDDDAYIHFLENEVFKNERNKREEESALKIKENALKIKLNERMEAFEERARATEAAAKEKEVESAAKEKLDEALKLHEKRIRENEKKLQTLAKMVKTTQIFAEEQKGVLKQTLETTLSDVEERLKTVESKSASASNADSDTATSNSTVDQGVQASDLDDGNQKQSAPAKRETSASRTSQKSERKRPESLTSEAVAQMMKTCVSQMKDAMTKQHERQMRLLNRKWEDKLKQAEERLGNEYRERLGLLETKLATKIEKVIIKVNRTTTKKLLKKKTAEPRAKKGQRTARESEIAGETEALAVTGHQGDPGDQESVAANLDKFELASSLKALTRNVLDEYISQRDEEGAVGDEIGRRTKSAPKGPAESSAVLLKKRKQATKVPTTRGALSSSNIANTQRQPNARKKVGHNAGAKSTKGSVEGTKGQPTKQARAREEYEKRQERLKALYNEWTSLELETKGGFIPL